MLEVVVAAAAVVAAGGAAAAAAGWLLGSTYRPDAALPLGCAASGDTAGRVRAPLLPMAALSFWCRT